jgi:hypothetical protein
MCKRTLRDPSESPQKAIRRGELRTFHRTLENAELMAKSQHLNLKSGTSAKAIPRRCQNGH